MNKLKLEIRRRFVTIRAVRKLCLFLLRLWYVALKITCPTYHESKISGIKKNHKKLEKSLLPSIKVSQFRGQIFIEGPLQL